MSNQTHDHAGHGHHSHGHHDHSGHGHHDHGQHDHAAHASEKSLAIAALLTGGFMLAEVAGGLVSGSLALIADAGHMLTDFASLGLAWYGFRLARRPADWRRSYGYDRFSILVAFANGLALFAIAAWIVVEAIGRLMQPGEVLGGLMLAVAVGGLLVNVACFFVLQAGDRENLNVRAAALHVAGDLLGSVAAIVAALVIMATNWTPIDPILSVVVALIILRAAWQVTAASAHILLEGTPDGIDTGDVRAGLVEDIPEIKDVHHMHVWSMTQSRRLATLHVRASNSRSAPETIAARVKAYLKDRHGIAHATVEVEYEACADR